MNRRTNLGRDIALVLLGVLVPATVVTTSAPYVRAEPGDCVDAQDDPVTADTDILDVIEVGHADDADSITLRVTTATPFNDSDVFEIAWDLDLDGDEVGDLFFTVAQAQEGGLEELEHGATVTRPASDVVAVDFALSLLDGDASYEYLGYTTKEDGTVDGGGQDDFGPCSHEVGTTQEETTTTTAGGSTTTTTSGGGTTTTTAQDDDDFTASEAEVSDETVRAGDAVTIADDSEGFEPNAELDIALFSEHVDLGGTFADANGNYEATVVIPSNTPPGEHDIVVSGPGAEAGTHLSGTTITVLGAQGSGGPTQRRSEGRARDDDEGGVRRRRGGRVALTGSDVERLLEATAVALLVGNLFLLAAVPRRRGTTGPR